MILFKKNEKMKPSNANGWEYKRLPQVLDASEAHAASHPSTGATFSWFHDRASHDLYVWLNGSPGPAFTVGSAKFGDVVSEWVRAAGGGSVVVTTRPGEHRSNLLASGFVLEEAVAARGQHETQTPAHDRYRKVGSRKSATDL